MESELELGRDGKYAICYKSREEPNYDSLIEEFEQFGLSVRFDRERWWVFLRSDGKQDIMRCMEAIGNKYPFRACKNSRPPKQNFEETNNRESRVSTATPPKVNKECSPVNVDDLWETVVINLPPGFTTDKISEMCIAAGVKPCSVQKKLTTGKGYPYCSVYLSSEHHMKQLTRNLRNAWYDDYGVIAVEGSSL